MIRKIFCLAVFLAGFSMNLSADILDDYDKRYENDVEVRAALTALKMDVLQRLDGIPPQTPSLRYEMEYLVGLEIGLDTIEPDRFSCSETGSRVHQLIYSFSPQRMTIDDVPISIVDLINFLEEICSE